MPRFLLYNKLIYQKETLCFSTNCSGYSLGTLAAVQRVMAVHPQAGRWSLFADCQRTVPGTAKKLMPQSTYKWVHYLLIAPFIRQYLTLASHSEIKFYYILAHWPAFVKQKFTIYLGWHLERLFPDKLCKLYKSTITWPRLQIWLAEKVLIPVPLFNPFSTAQVKASGAGRPAANQSEVKTIPKLHSTFGLNE